jgi:hypothetical protein
MFLPELACIGAKYSSRCPCLPIISCIKRSIYGHTVVKTNQIYDVIFLVSVSYVQYFFPLLALQPNSGLGRLHETFLFTSVTRSSTVDRTIEWEISSSQGLYLYKTQKKRTQNTNTKHACPDRDSNSQSRRPRERRQFMPYSARLP